MQDTEFYRQILGLEFPWTVSRVDLDLSRSGSTLLRFIRKGSLGPARSAAARCRPTIMLRRESGVIWTPAS